MTAQRLIFALPAIFALGCGMFGAEFDVLPSDASLDSSLVGDVSSIESGPFDATRDTAKALDGTVVSDSSADAQRVAESGADVTFDVASDSSTDVGIRDSAVDRGVDGGSVDSSSNSVDSGASIADGGVATVSLGGTLLGLAIDDTIVLQDDGGNDITLTTNGAFTFPSPVASGGTYDVTILTQPASPVQACTVSAGMGTAGAGGVTNIVVNCTTNMYTVGGTVAGLTVGDTLVLENGTSSLFVTVNGSFVFPMPVADGSAYDVTVAANPGMPAETCTVAKASGTVAGANVTAPVVTCVTNGFTVGGTLTGLAVSDQVELADNGSDNLMVGANGAFAFATAIPTGQPYDVTVTGSSGLGAAQSCVVVSGGSGVVGTANVTSVHVACTTLGLVTLASGLSSPQDIAVDSANVYWVSLLGQEVLSVPLGGGTVTTLASGQNLPTGIAVDSTSVYWTDGNGGGPIQSVPTSGGASTTLATGQAYPYGIAVSGSLVYWTDYTTGIIQSVPVGGGTITTIASGQSYPWNIVVDSANAYWTNYIGGSVVSAPLGGGSTTTLASGQNDPFGIVVNGANVYWTSNGNGTVVSAPVGGGAITTIASGQTEPNGLTSDGTNLYWTDYSTTGTVMSMPIGGGTVSTLATAQSKPYAIAVDATSLYWTDYSGTVMKLTPK